MRLFPNEEALNKSLVDFAAGSDKRLGWISPKVPLISNLDVYGNLALIRQYHENLPSPAARRLIAEYLRRYDLEHIATKRNPALTDRERFYVMLLRAIMVRDAVLVIDQPFKIIPYSQDTRLLDDALKVIDDSFKECYIFDLTVNKNRYGTGYAL